MPYSTKHRPFRLITPRGEDELLLHRFEGSEGLSTPFEFHLWLLSENDAVKPRDIVGKPVTLGVNAGIGYDDDTPCWQGVISSFGRTGSQWCAGVDNGQEMTTYEAVLRPWFWQLTLVENCRIFQQQSIPEIVDTILGEFTLGRHESELSGHYPPLDYCVQYNESNFDFISRLLERAGIHYWFKQDPDAGAETLVLSDHQEQTGRRRIATHRFAANWAEQDEPVVFALARRQRMRTARITMRDYDYEQPAKEMQASVSTVLKVGAKDTLQRFSYPGDYRERNDGNERARMAMEIEEASHELLDGASTRVDIRPGMAFQLDDAPVSDLDASWRTLSVNHQGENNFDDDSGEGYYRNDFTVMPLATPYRPPRNTPRPRIHGAQVGIITGPAGEEIYTDKLGRVKVHFIWDHLGKTDGSSSCWARVVQGWAGNGWGMFFLPRIGMEVILQFENGDPDYPLVTGCVYNGNNLPPYPLPAEATKSGLKTYSSKGGSGFNELRFEDKKDSEEVFLHAQKDLQVRVKGDSIEKVEGERHIIIDKDRLEKVTGDQHAAIDKSRFTSVSKDDNLDVGSNLQIGAGADLSISVGSKAMLDSGQAIHLKAGMKVVVEAGMQISLKAGPSSIVLGPAGVTIDGPLVKVNCGGSPASAEKPQKPDAAKGAKEAVNAQSGKKVDAAQQAQAKAMRQAALAGLPFCAECAAAKAALAAMR